MSRVKTNAGHPQASHLSLPLVHAFIQLSDLVASDLVGSSRYGIRHDDHGRHVVSGAGVFGDLPPHWPQPPVVSVAMAGRSLRCGRIFHSTRVRGNRVRGGLGVAVGRMELGVGRAGHAAFRVARDAGLGSVCALVPVHSHCGNDSWTIDRAWRRNRLARVPGTGTREADVIHEVKPVERHHLGDVAQSTAVVCRLQLWNESLVRHGLLHAHDRPEQLYICLAAVEVRKFMDSGRAARQSQPFHPDCFRQHDARHGKDAVVHNRVRRCAGRSECRLRGVFLDKARRSGEAKPATVACHQD